MTDGLKDIDTHRLQLGMTVHLPSGWNFSLTPSYYDQKGLFESVNDLTPSGGGVYVEGKEDFWITDASASYRLAKRRGFVSAGVQNVFDKDFIYYDTNSKNSSLQSERTAFVSLTLAF